MHAIARTRCRGVSLVELLAVVVILGVLAVAAVPKLSSADVEKVDAAAIRVAEAVRLARSESMRTGMTWGITVNRSDQTVRVSRFDVSTNPASPVEPFYHPVRRQPVVIDLETSAATLGVQIINQGQPFRFRGSSPTSMLLFDGDGVPIKTANSALSRYAMTVGQIRLGLGGVTRDVTVTSFTGRVAIR